MVLPRCICLSSSQVFNYVRLWALSDQTKTTYQLALDGKVQLFSILFLVLRYTKFFTYILKSDVLRKRSVLGTRYFILRPSIGGTEGKSVTRSCAGTRLARRCTTHLYDRGFCKCQACTPQGELTTSWVMLWNTQFSAVSINVFIELKMSLKLSSVVLHATEMTGVKAHGRSCNMSSRVLPRTTLRK